MAVSCINFMRAFKGKRKSAGESPTRLYVYRDISPGNKDTSHRIVRELAGRLRGGAATSSWKQFT